MSEIKVSGLVPSIFVSNRQRFTTVFKNTINSITKIEGEGSADNDLSGREFILFVGKGETMRNADTESLFRQDSNFLYVCGVDLPDCFFVMDISGSKSILFVPDISEKYSVWNGKPKSLEQWKVEYGVSEVLYCSQLQNFIENAMGDGKLNRLFTLEKKGLPKEEWFNQGNADVLKKALFTSRATKTPSEIKVIMETCRISGEAHIDIMQKCKVGYREWHLESIFSSYATWRGCRQMAYLSIVGSGPNSAILHYNTNNALINDGDIVVVDAGCEYMGYASDITRTFPANGKFSNDQKTIYSIVLNAQKETISLVKPGIEFRALSRESSLLLLQGLIKFGFIIGCTPEEALQKDLHGLFMPHGLGHLMGLDVHDVSIYPETPLEPGMVITIEPGVYFIPDLINKYLGDPKVNVHLNAELMRKFSNFGGVRIEDDILVTITGSLCLTEKAPKEIHQIEEIMAK